VNAAVAIHVANQAVPLERVLDSLHIPVRSVPGPLACPIHKFGLEDRPSAQIYADNSIYCFRCAQQYGPVDVWAAARDMDLERAAEDLLRLWPVDAETLQRLEHEARIPHSKPVDQSIFDQIEGFLLESRHEVPLALYRSWVQRAQEATVPLSRLVGDEQFRQIEHFRNTLRRAFAAIPQPER
jgi:hypothetical protein